MIAVIIFTHTRGGSSIFFYTGPTRGRGSIIHTVTPPLAATPLAPFEQHCRQLTFVRENHESG
jgi:hypothetical protein